MIPTKFIECNMSGYPARTNMNIMLSDITIAFAVDFNTPGERLTKRLCESAHKNYCKVDLKDCENHTVKAISNVIINDIMNHPFRKWIGKDSVIINIAGNGIYHLEFDQEAYNRMMADIVGYLVEHFPRKIYEIVSGGQTGIDEAGIIAAQRNNINSSIVAPQGWLFRNKQHKDISDEKLFKERFIQE